MKLRKWKVVKMEMEISLVKEEEKLILAHLIELYEYDFSDFEDTDVNGLGLYGYSYLDYYWTEKRRFPYFIKVNGFLAGFVMVCDYCYVSSQDTLVMSEFFVMKKYRGKGIGKRAAIDVLRKHPGKWELMVHPKNLVSHSFWDSVVKEVSKNYQIVNDVENVYDHYLAKAYLFSVE